MITTHSLLRIKPTFSLSPVISFFSSLFQRDTVSKTTRNLSTSLGKKNIKKFLPVALLIVLIIGAAVLLFKGVGNKPQVQADERIEIKGPISSMQINKNFEFPIRDAKGKEVTKLTFVIESAELRDEIVVKGKRAAAIKGRVFLILNAKINNTYDKALEMNVRDYLRLSRNGKQDELLAPDIHNDPTTIQAISTKYTRLGFPINDTDKDLKLMVGEINGEKQTVDIVF